MLKLLSINQLIETRTFLELGQSDEPSPRTFKATDTLSVIALKENHAIIWRDSPQFLDFSS